LDGLPALEAKEQPCPLAIKQQEQLSDCIDKQSRSTKAGRLTGETIRAYISEQLQIIIILTQYISCFIDWVLVGSHVVQSSQSNPKQLKMSL
jgi:hypothetical protein